MRILQFCSATLAASALTAGMAYAEVQTWNIDPAHTAAQFSVRHMGISTVRGAFTKVSGAVQYDPADPAKTSVEAVIDASSIDTRVDRRDQDLKSDHFFDVAKYPTLTFKSTRVEPNGEGKLKVYGDLTIHGTTKPVVLEVEGLGKPMKDPRGNEHLGASATTTINRTDFGVSGAPGMVGTEVPIVIDMELVHSTGAPQGGPPPGPPPAGPR